MSKECLFYNGEFGNYELLDFDPNGLTNKQIKEKARQELIKKYCVGEDEEIGNLMENVYLINIDDLERVI